jgi:hypothetical protein
MKSYAELTVANSDIQASGLVSVIEKEIVEAMEPVLIGKQLLGMDTFLQANPGTTRRLRKVTAIPTGAVTTLSEGGTFAALSGSNEQTFSYVSVTPARYAVSEQINSYAILTSDFNVLNQVKNALAKAFARKIDQVIWYGILNRAYTTESVTVGVTASATTSITLANWTYGGLLSITKVTGLAAITIQSGDYYTGKISVKNTSTGTTTIVVGYEYINRTDALLVNANTAGQLSLEDLVKAKLKIVSQYGKPQVMVAYEDEVGDLMLDSRVISNVAYNKDALFKGAVSQLQGLEVLQSEVFWPGIAAIIHPGSDLGFYVSQEKLKVKSEEIALTPGDIMISIYETMGIGIVNSGMVCAVVNSASNSANL